MGHGMRTELETGSVQVEDFVSGQEGLGHVSCLNVPAIIPAQQIGDDKNGSGLPVVLEHTSGKLKVLVSVIESQADGLFDIRLMR